MTEKTEVMSNREKHLERLKTKYPDKEFIDDEVLFGQINDDYDQYDQELEDYRGREQAIAELFATNPRSAAFLMDWRDGEDPIVGLIRKFGDDFTEALKDPEKQEALAAANKEYAERIAKEQEYEVQYQENMNETLATLESMQTELGLSDDDIDQAMGFLIGIMKDGLLGKFSRESVDMALKALHHDGDVALAEREGEVRGRNSKIEEKLRRRERGDGTAQLAGKNGGAGGNRPEMPSLGVLDEEEKSIWDRKF